MFYEAREKVIESYDEYTTIVSRAKYEAKRRKKLKTLTSTQMPQELPIALEQVKAGNTSENVPNEILQIIYFLFQAKEITKKVYNNIVNSIKL